MTAEELKTILYDIRKRVDASTADVAKIYQFDTLFARFPRHAWERNSTLSNSFRCVYCQSTIEFTATLAYRYTCGRDTPCLLYDKSNKSD